MLNAMDDGVHASRPRRRGDVLYVASQQHRMGQ
jgi:hypothetical protein